MASSHLRSAASSTSSSGGAAAAGGFTFQARLGVLFGLDMLAQRSIEHSFGLGAAHPVWMGFETDSPVDDLLVLTSAGGYVAVQAKTSADLSAKPSGALAKAIDQFVRHWLVCRSGDGRQLWNRPLEADKDRLVLAVGPTASSGVRVDLAAALRLRRQPGAPSFTQAQKRADAVFEQCVRAAFATCTIEPWTPAIVDDLARLVRVWTFDPDGADGRSMDVVAGSMIEPTRSRALIDALSEQCAEWIAERGSADVTGLRRALAARHVDLEVLPGYADDVRALSRHSEMIGAELERYESTGDLHVERECQTAVVSAAEAGPLLVIGEPGAGKSAVINALARSLRGLGDVVQLAVDQYTVSSLDDLRAALELRHGLIEVLQAWDGSGPAWLIVDALDATRGGQGEGVFRALIERVIALKGRWRVIASIRSFDLRMGQRFRDLFRGDPPDAFYGDRTFPHVRHVRVPQWSAAEFEQVLVRSPVLGAALASAPPKLRELAEVPFNTRLIRDLLDRGVAAKSLRAISNQAQLMRLYWDSRVVEMGAPAEACLRRVVMCMVEARALRAPASAVIDTQAAALTGLEGRGVLIRVENGRYVQFRHHLLFDYVASLLLLDPDAIVAGRVGFPKAEAKGLMLAPALGFLLQELWASDPRRSRFWTAVGRIVLDREGDPMLRSVAGRLGAELPEEAADIDELARRVAANDRFAVEALQHAAGALAVRLEDEADVRLDPWAALVGGLAADVRHIAVLLRFLVHLLLNVAKPGHVVGEVGTAARALLRDAFERSRPEAQAAALIPMVVATYATDASASRQLLETMFDPDRFAAHGWEDVPVLCYNVAKLADVDPDFVGQVFGATYGRGFANDVKTQVSGSRILALHSNAGQDYSMAMYSLSEFFPAFLRRHPGHAVAALNGALEAYVERRQPTGEGRTRPVVDWVVGGRPARVVADGSHYWAHDPGAAHAPDAQALVGKLTATLGELPEDAALDLARHLTGSASLAIVWARLFLAAIRRGDGLVGFLWPYAASEACLTTIETRKDAVDLVAVGYGSKSLEDRRAFEEAVIAFRMDRFDEPEAARALLLDRLFGAIEAGMLVTEAASAWAARVPESGQGGNERPFWIRSGWAEVAPYEWIQGLDRSAPANVAMMAAVDEARRSFGLDPEPAEKPEIVASAGILLLQAIAKALPLPGLHTDLLAYGQATIAEGCALLANGGHLKVLEGGEDLAKPYLGLLEVAIRADRPVVAEDTEAAFARTPSWSAPAPRVGAAAAALDACLARPDLYPALAPEVDRLLDDTHPAVRMNAGDHLVRLWDIDQQGFWDRLGDRLAVEPNVGVLLHLVNVLRSVLHVDPKRTEALGIALMGRIAASVLEAPVGEMLADVMAVLSVAHASEAARAILERWLDAPAVHKDRLRNVLVTLREGVVLGLRAGEPEQGPLRHRAQALMHGIVDAAARHLDGWDLDAVVSDEDAAGLQACMELLDIAALELYFASGRTQPDAGRNVTDGGCATYLAEVSSTLERIGDHASPHTAHHLLQLIEILAPHGPARAFDLMAHVVGVGSKRSGYQNEPMGADLIVRMVGAFLADHKEVFEVEARRLALIGCLETFMDSGWPVARRLLYRLPELFQ